MKAPREYRRWINRVRSKRGKPNGAIRGCFLDSPEMERKMANSKRVKTGG